MTSPVGSLSSVTFTDEVIVTSERFPLPAIRERNSRADWPALRDDHLKVEIFQLGANIAPLETRRWKRAAENAPLETRRPHRVAPNAPPGKISRLSQPHASVHWLFMGFSRAKKIFRFWCERTLTLSMFKQLQHRSRQSEYYTTMKQQFIMFVQQADQVYIWFLDTTTPNYCFEWIAIYSLCVYGEVRFPHTLLPSLGPCSLSASDDVDDKWRKGEEERKKMSTREWF